MKPLGMFAEFGYGDPGVPRMRDAVRPTASANEQPLVRYLLNGQGVIDVMEWSNDVLDGAHVDHTGSMATDGDWFWREDLAHYVAKYHLELDPSFLSHVAARNYDPPQLDDEALRRATEEVFLVW